MVESNQHHQSSACSVGWFVSLLVREEVLLAGLCERKILFRLEIYDRLRQATAKRTGCISLGTTIFHRYIQSTIMNKFAYKLPTVK